MTSEEQKIVRESDFKELIHRPNISLEVNDGDEVRLENTIYKVGADFDDGAGIMKDRTEDHVKDIPFAACVYDGGVRAHDLFVYLKEHDIIQYEGQKYMVVRLQQQELADDYELINLTSLLSAVEALHKTDQGTN